jgi:hypothetical protein
MPTIEAKCPECGLRVQVSERGLTRTDPPSKCIHKDGWERCPNIKPELSKARSGSRKPAH